MCNKLERIAFCIWCIIDSHLIVSYKLFHYYYYCYYYYYYCQIKVLNLVFIGSAQQAVAQGSQEASFILLSPWSTSPKVSLLTPKVHTSESVQWVCRHLWSLDFLLTSVVLIFPHCPHYYGYYLCPYAPHLSDVSSEILIFFFFLILFCSHPSIIRNCHVYNLSVVLFFVDDQQIQSPSLNFMVCSYTKIPQHLVNYPHFEVLYTVSFR